MLLPLVWNSLSEVREYSSLLSPRNLKTNPYEAYAKSIPQDTGDESFITKATLDKVTKRVTCDNDPYTAILPNCVGIDVAYDQLNRLNVAWKASGELYLYWFDAVSSAFVTTNFGEVQEFCFLMDDTRHYSQAGSMMLLFYTRDLVLYYRSQRDRFSIEYTIATLDAESELVSVGLNNFLRLQITISGVELADLTDYIVMIDSAYAAQDKFFLGVGAND